MASGRNVCWFLDCDCITGLPGIPPKRIEDAMYMMQHQMNLDLRDRRGKPRKLPDREAQSQLCVEHRPALTSKRIIRATVLLLAARRYLGIARPAMSPHAMTTAWPVSGPQYQASIGEA